jgi:hypothetical protein
MGDLSPAMTLQYSLLQSHFGKMWVTRGNTVWHVSTTFASLRTSYIAINLTQSRRFRLTTGL